MFRTMLILIVSTFISNAAMAYSNCISTQEFGDGNKVIITNKCGGTAKIKIQCDNGKTSTRIVFACGTDYFLRSVTCQDRSAGFHFQLEMKRGGDKVCINY